MKRFWYTAAFAIALGLMCCSCGGNNKSETSTPSEQTDEFDMTPEEMETDTIEDEDDGDPNIKAASPDRMKMVVDNHGNLVGRYVQTNQTTYTVSVQDEIEVPRLGHKIVEYKAKNGQGVVFTRRKNVNVRSQPNLQSPVICQITCKEGELPDTYPCLGKTQGWYKIKARNTEGYVRHDLVEWDGMSTF
ncbi:MAG: hypothetical protein F083_2073 [bacterium F083]|nr:MAG: hypothetical protein F083_2073 [bacterium F083]